MRPSWVPALLVTLVLGGCGSAEPSPDGPLVTQGGGTGAAPKPIGKAFSWGSTLLFTEPDATDEIVLDAIELAPRQDGVELVGIRVARDFERDSGFFFVAGDWPPTRSSEGPIGPTAPVSGFRIRPSGDTRFGEPKSFGVNVIVGLRLTRPGSYRIDGLQVAYHQGDDRYDETLASGFEVRTS